MAINRVFTRKVRILVAPLDWGLGHATRCIPIIREFLQRDAEVLIAAEGPVSVLLKQEFPTLEILELRGYRIKYARTATGLAFGMLKQIPRILQSIRREKKWLDNIIKSHQIDVIISDNRYGLYSGKIPSVFISHQLTIKTGSVFTEKILRKFNYKFINRFTECWVPDKPGPFNYAGALSHPPVLPRIPVFYTGILSRLNPAATTVIPKHLFISLSGPEPQRSIFEEKIISQVSHYNHSATIVRGLPGEERMIPSTNSLRFFNHLPAVCISEEMAKADLVITRSGYSTIMDLVTMNKKSILVPTPGQTEQVYLAGYLTEKKIAMGVGQAGFNLVDVIERAKDFFGNNPSPDEKTGDDLPEKISEYGNLARPASGQNTVVNTMNPNTGGLSRPSADSHQQGSLSLVIDRLLEKISV
ncbi:MAG: glycosyltransferase [Chitinophagaceae bacterium]